VTHIQCVSIQTRFDKETVSNSKAVMHTEVELDDLLIEVSDDNAAVQRSYMHKWRLEDV